MVRPGHTVKRRGTAGPVGVTASRQAALAILTDVRQGALLDAAFDRRTEALDLRDRRWVHELVWGVLRTRASLDALIATRVRGGLGVLHAEVLELLRLGAQQLLAMGSVPAYAAIGQTVELVKARHGVGAARLVNAVLRRIDRERSAGELEIAEPADSLAALAQRTSHPLWVVARWVARWGMAEAAQLLEANNGAAPIILRPYGVATEVLAAQLAAESVTTTPVALTGDSLQLPPGVALTTLGAFREGCCFVQDPAATLVARYADIPEGSTVADLCAAPGGKALELSRRAARVLCADRSPARVARMTAGFTRVGTTRLQPLVADATAPAIAPVDMVLLDVPCTGTGTFRRHPDARWRLQISDLAVLGAAQRAILAGAARVVRPGGLLVYSTCSLEPEENDAVVDAFLAAHGDFSLEPPAPGTVPASVLDEGRLRVLPQRHGHDGAFAARLRRAA
jgi:16S rRNA (cytosine967-C5)-methyltransferase